MLSNGVACQGRITNAGFLRRGGGGSNLGLHIKKGGPGGFSFGPNVKKATSWIKMEGGGGGGPDTHMYGYDVTRRFCQRLDVNLNGCFYLYIYYVNCKLTL